MGARGDYGSDVAGLDECLRGSELLVLCVRRVHATDLSCHVNERKSINSEFPLS